MKEPFRIINGELLREKSRTGFGEEENGMPPLTDIGDLKESIRGIAISNGDLVATQLI